MFSRRAIAIVVLLAGAVRASPLNAGRPVPAPSPGRPAGRPLFVVITHGFQKHGKRPPLWTSKLAVALKQRGISNSLAINWAEESNAPFAGWSESAGDETFARIMWEVVHARSPFDLHLVAHSRGAVVNSEAHRRLTWYSREHPGIDRVVDRLQVTWCDPHPANGRAGLFATSKVGRLGVSIFEKAVRDPDPQIWSKVTFADVYFQRTEKPSPEPYGINPFGLGNDAGFATHAVLHDLTDRYFVPKQPEGKPKLVLLWHGEIGRWYADTVSRNCRPADRNGVVSGGGFYYSLAGAGWKTRRQPKGRGVIPKPPGPPTVFNGDFRLRGATLRNRQRIPGWFSNRRISVTKQRLRISGSASEPAGVVIHNPMYFPPAAARLRFQVTNETRNPATLGVHLVRVLPDIDGNLVASARPADWTLLKTTSRKAATPANTRVVEAAFAVDSGKLGAVASICFVLSPPKRGKASVEIDNVRLVSGRRAAKPPVHNPRRCRPSHGSTVNRD